MSPRQPRAAKTCADVEPHLGQFADMLTGLLPPRVGFALVVFDMHNDPGPGRVAYVANGNRPQIATQLIEIARRIQGDA